MLDRIGALELQRELALLGEKIAVLRQEIETGYKVKLDACSQDPTDIFFLHSQVTRLSAAGEYEELLEIIDHPGLHLHTIRVSDDRTPLHLAAMGGHAKTAEILISAGIDVCAVDFDGSTAYDLALAAGHSELAVRLKALMPEPPMFFALSPTMVSSPPSLGSGGQPFDFNGFVVMLVGLPGRGKSFVAANIARYFSWHSVNSRVLCHEQFRLSELGSVRTDVTQLDEKKVASAIALTTRTLLLSGTGLVVLDSSHALRRRREALRTAILQITQLNPERFVMVEVVSSSERVILRNVRRLAAPVTQEELEEYSKRAKEEERLYETLDAELDKPVPFIRLIEERRVELNNIQGAIPTALAHLLHNLKQEAPCLYLTESGEWEDLVAKKFGGDSPLTASGNCYSLALSEFILKEMGGRRFFVMSSSATRAVQTCQQFVHFASADPANNASQDEISSGFGTSPFSASGNLNLETMVGRCRVAFYPTLADINYGDCEGQSEESVRALFPGTLQSIFSNPFNVAWPNGESMHQIFTSRLVQHIHDIQASQVPVVVVAHKCIIQGLLAYFGMDKGPSCSQHINVPLHTVFKLSLGFESKRKIEEFTLQPRVDELMEEVRKMERQMMDVHRMHPGATESSPFVKEETQSFEM